MKIFTLLSFFILMLSSGCSSQKNLIDPPFAIGKADCRQWYGATEQSGTGWQLQIEVTGNTSEVEIQQAFFRGKIADLRWEKKEEAQYMMADFENEKKDKPDIIMDADPKKEVGNQPPSLTPKEFPFELELTEAVVSYSEEGKVKYFKVTGIKEGKPLFYQSMPKKQ